MSIVLFCCETNQNFKCDVKNVFIKAENFGKSQNGKKFPRRSGFGQIVWELRLGQIRTELHGFGHSLSFHKEWRYGQIHRVPSSSGQTWSWTDLAKFATPRDFFLIRKFLKSFSFKIGGFYIPFFLKVWI